MKVKCIIHEFYDREQEKYVKEGEIFEVKPERAKVLIQKGFVEEFKESKEKQNKEPKDAK